MLLFCACGASIQRANPETIHASPMLQRDVYDEHVQQRALVASMSRDQKKTSARPSRAKARKSTARASTSPSHSAATRRASPAPKPTRRNTPALSTVTSKRSYEPEKSPRSAAGSRPDEAAVHVWEAMRKRGKRMSDASRTHIPTMHAECKKRGAMAFSRKLKPGQIIFFHNTFDANDDGRNNDWYTHVAIVEEVDGVGTAKLSSSKGGRKHRFVMNMNHHNMHQTDSGLTLNDQLRARHKKDLPYTQYLAGELYAGTCTL
ncbi:MAG: hypothetical protein VYE40_11355 [Myxococcota bacterium]|nr:hypothetical protein [Myxococcota bacterium]